MADIKELFVYPMKSCGGIPVEELKLLSYGPRYDRMFVIVDERGQAITQREEPRLCLVRPIFFDQFLSVQLPPWNDGVLLPLEREDGEECEAVVWGDRCLGFDEGNLIAEAFSFFLERRCRVVRYVPKNPRMRMSTFLGERISVSFADAYPLLVISDASLNDLNGRVPLPLRPIRMDRFRPNIVVGHAHPYEEDEWSAILANGVLLQGANQCVRCATTLVNQANGYVGKEPLRTLNEYRKTPKGVVFGRNFRHLGEGVIRRGDIVDTPHGV